jgi:hypothetical protein
MDQRIGPDAFEQLANGVGVAHLDALRGSVRGLSNELRAEIAGRPGDVKPHP